MQRANALSALRAARRIDAPTEGNPYQFATPADEDDEEMPQHRPYQLQPIGVTHHNSRVMIQQLVMEAARYHHVESKRRQETRRRQREQRRQKAGRNAHVAQDKTNEAPGNDHCTPPRFIFEMKHGSKTPTPRCFASGGDADNSPSSCNGGCSPVDSASPASSLAGLTDHDPLTSPCPMDNDDEEEGLPVDVLLDGIDSDQNSASGDDVEQEVERSLVAALNDADCGPMATLSNPNSSAVSRPIDEAMSLTPEWRELLFQVTNHFETCGATSTEDRFLKSKCRLTPLFLWNTKLLMERDLDIDYSVILEDIQAKHRARLNQLPHGQLFLSPEQLAAEAEAESQLLDETRSEDDEDVDDAEGEDNDRQEDNEEVQPSVLEGDVSYHQLRRRMEAFAV